MNSIKRIFTDYGPAYAQRFGERMPSNHKKTIQAICNCGTGFYGQHAFACGDCGESHYTDSSCGNRHCPTCQGGKSDEWLNKQLAKVLPVNYFMFTFTVPQELRELIRSNQKICYNALFKAASGAMKKLAKDPKYIGCDLVGFTGVLHTWTRQLEYHPHVHFIIPGGGLTKDGLEWKSCAANQYVNNRPLSVIYRAKFIDELEAAGLTVPPCVWDPDWVIDARQVGNGKRALKYLAQYIFRVAIAPSRIEKVTDTHVIFKYQRSGEKKWRRCALKTFEFMRRYLQHTLPSGFTKIRHYGFLAPNSRTGLPKVRELICALYEILVKLLPKPKPPHRKPWNCKTCGGLIRWHAFIPPQKRGYG